MYSEILENIDDDSIIVTANQELARYLQHIFTKQKISSLGSKPAWATPNILPMTAWLQKCWQTCSSSHSILLTEFQSTLLWQRIIKTSDTLPRESKKHDTWKFYNVQSLAQQIKNAWDRINLWKIPLDSIEAKNNDIHKFVSWATVFEEHLVEKNLITFSQLPQEIAKLIQEHKLLLPKKIYFYGFHEINPATQALLDNINKVGIDFHIIEQKSEKQAHTYSVEITSEIEEIKRMARWAKEYLKNHQSTTSSQCRIGCIIPGIANIYDQVQHIFTEIFHPYDLLPGINTAKPAQFNISLGKSLDKYPIIHIALSALSLLVDCQNAEKLSACLLSPYLHQDEQDNYLATIADTKLQTLKVNNINKKNFLMSLFYSRSNFLVSYLPNRWHQFLDTDIHMHQTHTMCIWLKLFTEKLHKLGWPGNRTLNSEEYQTIKKWQELLIECENISVIHKNVSLSQAVYILVQLAQQTIFQPEAHPDIPVQILQPLDATGHHFDTTWVMRCNNNYWPDSIALNPFLPAELQRQQHMPKADYQHQLHYYQNLQNYLIENTKDQVIFSYSSEQDDQVLLPSSLITDITPIELNTISQDHNETLTEQLFSQHNYLEAIVDNFGSALLPQQYVQEGGSQLLQEQADCPFKAYTKYRLHTKNSTQPHIGLTATERGTLLHNALKTLWHKLDNQAALCSMSTLEINKTIDKTLQLVLANSIFEITPFLNLEAQRLTILIKQWLAIEKQRKPFKVIHKEKAYPVNIGKLQLTVRVDRIDQLQNAHEIIIDYKTSINNPINHWTSYPLESIQLPLYATFANISATGIAYAELHPKKMDFNGIFAEDCHTDFDHNVKSIQQTNQQFTNWQQLQDYWQHQLTQLAQDFTNGKAKVTPRNTNICYTCQFKPFCRIT